MCPLYFYLKSENLEKNSKIRISNHPICQNTKTILQIRFVRWPSRITCYGKPPTWRKNQIIWLWFCVILNISNFFFEFNLLIFAERKIPMDTQNFSTQHSYNNISRIVTVPYSYRSGLETLTDYTVRAITIRSKHRTKVSCISVCFNNYFGYLVTDTFIILWKDDSLNRCNDFFGEIIRLNKKKS